MMKLLAKDLIKTRDCLFTVAFVLWLILLGGMREERREREAERDVEG